MPIRGGKKGPMADAWGTPEETDEERQIMAQQAEIAAEEPKGLGAFGRTTEPSDPQPEPEPEPVEEPAVEAQEPEPEADDDPGAYVDTRERKESYSPDEYGQVVRSRDYFRKTLEETQVRQARVEERLGKILGALEEKEEKEKVAARPPRPALEEDPAGHLAHRQIETEEKLDEVTGFISEERQRREEEAKREAFARTIEAQEAAHLRTTGTSLEEFRGRVAAVRIAKVEEAMAEYGLSEPDAQRWVMETWEPHIVDQQMRLGRNPASFFDAEFKRRGLSPVGANGGGGGRREPVPDEADKQLTKIEKGRRASPTARGGGGSTGVVKVNYDTLAEMPDDEFDAVMDRIRGTDKEYELHTGGTISLPVR